MNNHSYEPYDSIASIYDRWQNSFSPPYYKIVRDRLLKVLRKYRIGPGRFLDLACGTGDASVFMAEKGWDVTGVDSSVEMLQKAKRKGGAYSVNISFIQQRLENLELDGTFTLAGSFYDSLNHITSKRTLAKALKQIRKHLGMDSLFLFDSNTLSCYQNLWETTSVGHEEGYTLIIENRFDESSGHATSNITIFERGNGLQYEKRVAKVDERWYSDNEFERLLQRAGFEVIEREPIYLFRYNEPDPYKQWWVCKAV